MIALILHGPGKYGVEQNWKDPVVKPGWARIRVTHSGICGSDLPRFGSKGSYYYPSIPGHEFTGWVETPAPDSKVYRGKESVGVLPIMPCGECEGCRLFGPFHCQNYGFLGSRNDGGFAEFCLVPETNLFRIPEGIDTRVGAFIEPIAVALHVVRRSGFLGGSSALVYGAGAIGLLIALWLRAFGARQIAIADVREESLAIARKLGFDELLNPSSNSEANPVGFDFTYEAAGSKHAFCDAISRTRSHGNLTVVGRETGDTLIPLPQFEQLMRKELMLRACWGYDLRGDELLVREALSKGWFPIEPMITHQISLDESPAVIQQMLQRTIYYCKVLINMEKKQ